jgi:hypothetical protein
MKREDKNIVQAESEVKQKGKERWQEQRILYIEYQRASSGD